MTCSLGSVVKRGPFRASEDLCPLRASKRCASATLLTRLPDLDDRAPAARYAAAHPQLVVLGVDVDDPQVLDRHGLVPHLARHPLPLEDARGVGRGPDGAGLPDVVRAVGYGTATEAVTLDGTLKALALGGRADVHLLADLEDVHTDAASDLSRDVPQLLQVTARRRLVLLEDARVGPADLARGHEAKTYLHGVVAVLFGGAHGRHEVRLDLYDRHAHERPVVLEGLGHVLLASENCRRHSLTSPLSRCSRRPAGR